MPVDLLSPNEVHLWTIERDPCADLAELTECLSPVEKQRASRLRVVEKRESFVYNRALLRRILASYAGISPRDVPLTISPEGKPLWHGTSGNRVTDCLTFNLSHRGDLALLAVRRGQAVGVDLEKLEERTSYDALARQALSPREILLYQQLPAEDRPAAMLRTWTRKEAFLKAMGVGLGRPLAEIEVTFSVSEPPQILATGDRRQLPGDWVLESWSPQPGWFAALATPREGASLHLRFHQATSLGDWHSSPHVLAEQASCQAS